MRKTRIVADSSADLLCLAGVDFASVPLKILTEEREFTDDAALPVAEMIDYLDRYKGRSRSSCPNVRDFLTAFGDAEDVFCVTITGGLSGSYNTAHTAKTIYEKEHPGRRVFVLNSLSAGPEVRLHVEKIKEFLQEGLTFEEICTKIEIYRSHTALLFFLKSVKNFANNGRISPLLAKIVGIAGICIIGKASEEGTLEPLHKCQGETRSFARMIEVLRASGFSSGRICIAHAQNPKGAEAFSALICTHFPQAKVQISELRGLCSFYAEKGGILVGFETQ